MGIIETSPEAIPLADRDAGKQQLTQDSGVADLSAFVLALRDAADIIINEDVLAAPDLGIGDDGALLLFIKSIFLGSDHFMDVDVGQEGRYMMFTGHGYDFAILADGSENIDLLGFAPVLQSTVYYPPAEIFGTAALPSTGQLIADVTLQLELDDDGTVTAGNASGLNDGASALVLMSAEKRPGAPEVLVIVEFRCTVILSLIRSMSRSFQGPVDPTERAVRNLEQPSLSFRRCTG